MIGHGWEWTSSDFAAWPGFTPMIYRDYSVPFFGGDYKVLRGGSRAVAPSTIRPSFRNWDYPVRRQSFTGARMAWDARWVRHISWLCLPRRRGGALLVPRARLLLH